MTRTALAVAATLLISPALFAQPSPPIGAAQRPTFSPYLNLLNRGNNPGLNYLGIVRPQQQLQQQFNQLQQQTNQQTAALGQAYDSQLEGLTGALLPPTGNVSTFNNLGNYFGRIPMGNGFGGGGGGGGSARFGGGGGAASSLQRPAFAGGSGGGDASRGAGDAGGGLRGGEAERAI